MRYHLLLLLATLLLYSCMGWNNESERKVKRKTLTYLQEKYNREFVVKDFHQYFHGGIWKYQTTLDICPKNELEPKFTVRYSAKRKEIISENFKRKFWELQIERDIEAHFTSKDYIYNTAVYFKRNRTLYFASDTLPFYSHYTELFNTAKHPAIDLKIEFLGKPKRTQLKKLMKVNRFLKKLPVNKIEVEILWGHQPDPESMLRYSKQLTYRITNDRPMPNTKQIKQFLIDYRSDSLYMQHKKLYVQAVAMLDRKQIDSAKYILQRIVDSTSVYRSYPHAPTDAAYSVEAAYHLALLARNEKNYIQERYYIERILNRMKDQEAKLYLSVFYKYAMERMDSIPTQN